MQAGAFGQGSSVANMIMWGVVAVGLAGCLDPSGARYVGVVRTVQGACGLGFDASGAATATLMVRGDQVIFAPSDGVTVLPGRVSGAGHVVAGSSSPGADKKAFAQVFEGDRKGDEVTGVFGTPRCRASVVLRRG